MENGTQLVCIFSGTEILVNLLKDELEKAGVSTLVKNEFHTGVISGFGGGVPSLVDLYIQQEDIEKAAPIINEFRTING